MVSSQYPVATLAAGALLVGGAFWLKMKWKTNTANTSNESAREIVSVVHEPHGSDAGKPPVAVKAKLFINAFQGLMEKAGCKEVHRAAAEGKTHLLAILIDVDPENVDIEGPELITPIMLAAGNGHVETSQLLLERGGLKRCNAVDKRHMTALAYAALHGHMDTARLLVEYIKTKHGTKNIIDRWFMRPTPLHCAISARHYAIAMYLIEQGACLLSKDLSGDTPVHIAVCKNVDPEFMCYLVKKCDDINIFNRQEYTPLDVAKSYGHVTLEEILQRVGAKTAEQCKLIIERDKKEAAYIRWLEHEYGDINMIHFDGLTFLDKARLKGYAATVEVLVRAGAKTARELKEIKKREERE